jgi:hypothetical protein
MRRDEVVPDDQQGVVEEIQDENSILLKVERIYARRRGMGQPDTPPTRKGRSAPAPSQRASNESFAFERVKTSAITRRIARREAFFRFDAFLLGRVST